MAKKKAEKVKVGAKATNTKVVPSDIAVMASAKEPDCLLIANFLPPGSIRLQFGDGFGGDFDWALLRIDSTQLRLETLRTAKAGAALEIISIGGKKVRIDSTAIRMLVDPKFAAHLEARSDRLARDILPIAQLKEIAKQPGPPPEWYADPEERPW